MHPATPTVTTHKVHTLMVVAADPKSAVWAHPFSRAPFLTANGEEGADPTTGTSRRAAILLCSSQACRVYRDGLFSVPHSKTGALLGDGPLRRLDE